MVEWREIEGYGDCYKVNSDGRVWSKYKNDYLSLVENKDDGYIRVALKDATWLLHRLIATVFYGHHENMFVNHIDGNKRNNSLKNLEWVTSSESAVHCAYNLSGQTLATEQPDLEYIRDLYYEDGYSYSQIADMFNVNKSTIRYWLGVSGTDTTTVKEFEVLEDEIVKPIPGYPHYFASNFGRILSNKSGTALKPQLQPNGYTKVGMKVDGRRYNKYIHRLVMAAFYGESDLVVNHKDKDRTNNRLNNLEYITQSDNVKKSAKRKLTIQDYYQIYKLKQSGWHREEIAKKYNICKEYVNRICRKVRNGEI